MESDAQIVELYEQLESCRKVSERIGVSGETVRRVLIANGIKRTHRHECERKKRKRYCPAIVGIYFFVDGIRSLVTISRETGIPASSVQMILRRKYGMTIGKATEQLNDKIEGDYLAGLSTYAIGEKYGIDHSTVSKRMLKRGHARGRGFASRQQRAAAIEKYGSEEAYRRHKNDRPWSHSKKRIEYWTNKTGAACDKTLTLKALIEKDGLTCRSCGIECDIGDKAYGTVGPTYPTLDHIIPLSKGGSHTWDNAQVLCFACNTSKGART